MKVKLYHLISDCIHRGVSHGYNRAYKYVDTPDKYCMIDNIEREIMNELCEYFDFEDGNEIPT